MTTEPKTEGGEAVAVLVEYALRGLPHNAPIKHPERDNAELAYTLTAFNYEEHPVGGEFWCNYWRGWWHRSHMDGSHPTTSAVEALARAAMKVAALYWPSMPVDKFDATAALKEALAHPEIAALLKETK